MSGSSVPSLSQWTQEHLKAVLDAASEEAFHTAFDAFISKHVHINVNGKHITREQYKQLLLGEKTFGTTAAPCTLLFEAVVEVPADSSHPAMAGTVGLFYEAVVTGRYVVLGVPNTSTIRSSLNIVITPDTSLAHEGTGYTLDTRRVSHLNEVVVDEENPMVHPKPRRASRRTSLTSPPPDANATTIVSASA
ncbi:hypothetical protein BKA93DRAFT_825402 [Sparassis latifolia]|uniref:NTF2 domain-containing protein n=1 Tax=Sparassis crispa TaxID=139825 RepID=A0A401G648_9APHY|nr:hypothetical protein SCP_0105220 [Sparassis crispa]GBE77642.1 hypothetical protein SCP_0105220 [Sparassis crispa]